MDKQSPGAGIELYGDHLVLDLMNTVMTVDGNKVERWESDAEVLAWLRGALDPAVELPAHAAPGSLAAARLLREQLRALVMAHKDGGAPDLALLNGLLERAPRQLLVREKDGAARLGRRFAGEPHDALLAPVVEAAAHLLTEERFERVKRCENPACTLWFLDRSKSQQRRWCSMALCGNRHKVSSFRKRKAAA
ncbi:CGNR zinc finger domain-containing protein [Massilia niastensis]|uniref:CGNR zinc finger domain-containing protein n=1 Tax=Massilia niastensis TaxID=544911 RepID=UPI00036C641A|nr:ABATE domain-containing protein [Massilia niastensis]